MSGFALGGFGASLHNQGNLPSFQRSDGPKPDLDLVIRILDELAKQSNETLREVKSTKELIRSSKTDLEERVARLEKEVEELRGKKDSDTPFKKPKVFQY
jgi:hypothetical protein